MSEYKDRQVKGLTVQSDAKSKKVTAKRDIEVFIIVPLSGLKDLKSTE
jgi:hypothetical protein